MKTVRDVFAHALAARILPAMVDPQQEGNAAKKGFKRSRRGLLAGARTTACAVHLRHTASTADTADTAGEDRHQAGHHNGFPRPDVRTMRPAQRMTATIAVCMNTQSRDRAPAFERFFLA
jgi:hypothetical protein